MRAVFTPVSIRPSRPVMQWKKSSCGRMPLRKLPSTNPPERGEHLEGRNDGNVRPLGIIAGRVAFEFLLVEETRHRHGVHRRSFRAGLNEEVKVVLGKLLEQMRHALLDDRILVFVDRRLVIQVHFFRDALVERFRAERLAEFVHQRTFSVGRLERLLQGFQAGVIAAFVDQSTSMRNARREKKKNVFDGQGESSLGLQKRGEHLRERRDQIDSTTLAVQLVAAMHDRG